MSCRSRRLISSNARRPLDGELSIMAIGGSDETHATPLRPSEADGDDDDDRDDDSASALSVSLCGAAMSCVCCAA